MLYQYWADSQAVILGLLLSLLVHNAKAAFDYSRSDSPENFDPQQADPRGRITCVGSLPQVNWPQVLQEGNGPGFSPAYFTLQQLCAKPQYGGARHGHLGGYCPYKFFGRFEGDAVQTPLPVVFDVSYQAEVSTTLSLPRLQAYCALRCYCSTQTDEPPRDLPYSPQSLRLANSLSLVYRGYSSAVNPDIDILRQALHQGSPRNTAKKIQINYWQESAARDNPNFAKKYIYLAPENRIFCPDDTSFPPLVLPGGWAEADFGSTQALCATVFDGGFKDANLGGFCDVATASTPMVAFSEEFTPSRAFTFGPGSSPRDWWKVASLQSYCFESCRCRYDDDPLSPLKSESSLSLGRDSSGVSIDLSRLSLSDRIRDSGRRHKNSLGFASSRGCSGSSNAGQCAADENLEGSTGLKERVCGQQCQKYSDCSGNGQPETCRCVVDPTELEAKAVGHDPVATVALCLKVALDFAGHRYLQPAKLGGRATNTEQEEWWNRNDLSCPCNSTYVSQSCCHEPSGMVWEAMDLNMGSLV